MKIRVDDRGYWTKKVNEKIANIKLQRAWDDAHFENEWYDKWKKSLFFRPKTPFPIEGHTDDFPYVFYPSISGWGDMETLQHCLRVLTETPYGDELWLEKKDLEALGL